MGKRTTARAATAGVVDAGGRGPGAGTAPARPQPAPWLAGVSEYAVARSDTPIDLWLDGNEGAEPPAALLETLRDGVPELWRRYPSARSLQEAWASRFGVASDRLLVTAGADEALDRTLRAFLAPGREIVLPVPTFEMLERYANAAGGRVVPVEWRGGPYPVDAVITAVTPRTAVVVVVTPNNPTGAVAAAAEIERLAAAAPHAVILVDLAYVEFADDDPTAAALELPNTVVTRTLSKAWGLAGLRLGCAIGPAELIRVVRAAGNPYTVSAPSMAVGLAWLAEGGGAVGRFVTRVREERARLRRLLEDAGAKALPSQANFVLARFQDATWVRDALASLGIAVRAFPGRPGLEDALRITCPGDEARFGRLAAAVEAALAPEAMLFDLDGVLADVSGSLRAAIVATAASYGVAVDPAEVSRAKAQGGANNDWELTRRLISAHGVGRPLAEVTARFEDLYQGADGRPGLRRRERVLCERTWLDALARRLPLAIVTGRPRADAERLVREQGIGAAFRAIVAMEDAPLKPDPAPVRLALERLGVRRAWMVGDTPDDVRAARAAGVVPLAIVAPGEEATIAGPALKGAGASRILSALADLGDLLP
jgi:histidinol-phosphate aminotransferase